MTYRPETVTVHAGQEEADPTTNARAVPIYQTTSYVFDDTEHAANLPQFGITVRFVDPEDPAGLAAHVDERTRLVFAETIGNPKLNVVDIRAWADAAHAQGLPLIVDNTAPTPYLARVFDHGADIAVHSATKYIGGHGTSIGGIIVDSGNFDWAAHAERFPGLTGPDAAYHGVVWTEAVGNLAFIIRARTVLANIGDAKSLAIHNATTTHSQLTPAELEAAGVPEEAVRLSVGIEHVEDLIADLDQALSASK